MDENKTQREQRLAAALRANLHRRKQQARERGRAEDDGPQDATDAKYTGDAKNTGDTGSDTPHPDRPHPARSRGKG